MNEQDSFRVEAALQYGFTITNDDADEYACNDSSLVAFAKVCERKGAIEALTGRDHGMLGLMQDVCAFHRACDVPAYGVPKYPDDARAELRARLLNEEVYEFHTALSLRDMVDIADALGDIIYIAIGTALEFGIPLDRVWSEIQRSNMAKVDPATGKAAHRADGKILKPPGWQPPDIAGALYPRGR